MKQSSTSTPFFTYIFCIIAYFIALFTNEFSIAEYLDSFNISFAEYKKISLYRMWGSIVAAIILLMVVGNFSYKKLIVFNIFIYWLSVFNIILIENSYQTIVFYFLLYSASTVIISTLLLGYILNNRKISGNNAIAIYTFSILIAYIISETFEYFTLNKDDSLLLFNLVVSNILPVILVVLILLLSPAYNIRFNFDEYRFFAVLRRMEIEMLLGFTIFYVIMILQNSYEIYQLADSLTLFGNTTNTYVSLCSLLIAIIFITIFIPRFNKHKVNIICIILLGFALIAMPHWSRHIISIMLGRAILIISLYILFASSLLILSDKFRDINLFSALSIYVLAAVFGHYCGYITLMKAQSILGINKFLISICFVLLGLLLYYLYLFKKHKLYR